MISNWSFQWKMTLLPDASKLEQQLVFTQKLLNQHMFP